jgi:hypothetical protein
MMRQQRTYDEVETASGVRRPTVKQWRRKNAPSLDSLEAVLNSLGFHLVAVPAHVEMPSVAAKAAELAALAKIELGEVWSAAVQIAALQLASTSEGERILAELDAEREAARASKSSRTRSRKTKPANDNVKRAASAA